MTATIQEKTIPPEQATVSVSGIIEMADGHAFVRTSGYRCGPDDVYVSAGQIRQYGLRKGDLIEGTARPQARGKHRPLARVDTVNGMPPGQDRPHFDDLTPRAAQSFAGAPGTGFTFAGVNPGRDSAVLHAGLNYRTSRITFYAHYDGSFSNRADDNAVTVLFADGARVEIPRASKRAVADRLWGLFAPRLPPPSPAAAAAQASGSHPGHA